MDSTGLPTEQTCTDSGCRDQKLNPKSRLGGLTNFLPSTLLVRLLERYEFLPMQGRAQPETRQAQRAVEHVQNIYLLNSSSQPTCLLKVKVG